MKDITCAFRWYAERVIQAAQVRASPLYSWDYKMGRKDVSMLGICQLYFAWESALPSIAWQWRIGRHCV